MRTLIIGNLHIWINRLNRARPQDIVTLGNEENDKFNHVRMRYWAHILPFGIPSLRIQQSVSPHPENG